LRANAESWAPTSDETLEAHFLMEAAAVAVEEASKDRALVMRLAQDAANLTAQLTEWRRLTDPSVLHVSLLRGLPAKLPREVFLHLAGDEPGGWVCGKCGTDRTKAACPKGHNAALTGECPMVGAAA
jgi:hypothetical protein